MKAVTRASHLLRNTQQTTNCFPSVNESVQSTCSISNRRSVHSYHVENNVTLMSNEKLSKGTNKYKYDGTNSSERPLTLLFPWMLSKDVHINKYANIYLNKGFDVVKVKVPPYDLFRPIKGSQITVGHVLNFLHENYSKSPIFIHGLSVGVYCFGEFLLKVLEDQSNNKDIHDRIVGQVFDSAVDVYGLPLAMAKVLASNSNVQNSLEKSINWFLKANYKTATMHYNKAAQQIYDNSAKAPGLFIYSKSDIVSPPKMSEDVTTLWQNRGDPVFKKCFDKSPHVGHYRKYQPEYIAEVSAFLEKIGLEPTKLGIAKATA